MKMATTNYMAKALLSAQLDIMGYETVDTDGYLHAESDKNNMPELLILTSGRKLSEGESSSVKITSAAVQKLEDRANAMAGDVTACVGLMIAKYSVDNIECILITTSELRRITEGSGTLAFKLMSNNFRYDYAKLENDDIGKEAVLSRMITSNDIQTLKI